MKILLVEDNDKLGALIIKVLKNHGLKADWAVDAKDCFEYFTPSYDVIILDRMLPDIDGAEICRELRQKHRFNLLV